MIKRSETYFETKFSDPSQNLRLFSETEQILIIDIFSSEILAVHFLLQEYYLGIGDLISPKGVFDIIMLNLNGIEKLPGRQIRFS